LLLARRGELLNKGLARCVGDVGLNLLAQCAFAHGDKPIPQSAEGLVAPLCGKLRAKAVEIAENTVVDDADKAVEFQQ
jgi:hypothetical protein